MTARRFWTERRLVAALSLAATYIFFIEYLPPFQKVHLYSDIQGYHYPLLQYSFQALKHGRLPQWDPTIYCGLTHVGNIQAALFYPPNWLLFAASGHRAHLSYKMLECLVFLHIWLAFVLCYLWLRGKRIGLLASLLGAAVFGFSGFVMSQDNHVGVICGYAWMPLGAWGIDQAAARRDWRPLWKVTAATALCFLAGYPPTWLVFLMVMVVYAAASNGHWRTALETVGALAVSLPLVMVQMEPARQAAALAPFDPKYGAGVRNPEFFASYFVPNYFDFGTHAIGWGRPPGQYLYIGIPAIFGLLWLVRGANLRRTLPAFAVLAVCLFGLTNPFNWTYELLEHSRLLLSVCHAWNFLEGLQLAAALIAAVSLNDFLRRDARPVPSWVVPAAIAALAVWSVRQFAVRLHGDFSGGARGALEPAVLLVLFVFGLYAVRASKGPRRVWMSAALLVAVFADYQVFGTNRAFDAIRGRADLDFNAWRSLSGIDDAVYHEMLAHPEYRVGFDEGASPWPTDMRHFGLTTPQGSDPLIPLQYRNAVGALSPFRTDRAFWPDPEKQDELRLLGVRYFVTMPGKPNHKRLLADPAFRLMQPSDTFFNVFEYLHARPAYYWERDGMGTIERTAWAPERREFHVRSEGGNRFVLVEQFYPGWSAAIDGKPTPIVRWGGAFQAVNVPAGEHSICFEFHTPGLLRSAFVSLAGLAALVFVVRSRRGRSTGDPGGARRLEE